MFHFQQEIQKIKDRIKVEFRNYRKKIKNCLAKDKWKTAWRYIVISHDETKRICLKYITCKYFGSLLKMVDEWFTKKVLSCGILSLEISFKIDLLWANKQVTIHHQNHHFIFSSVMEIFIYQWHSVMFMCDMFSDHM